MDKQRVYFVIDMKSFFASVECAERGLDAMTTDLVVADAERTQKTICLAVSPSLKAKGVKNRCRLFEIPKNLKYIIAKPQMKKYIEYAANIYAIYLQYIDKNDIHVYSIDECIIDVTDYLKLYNLKSKEFAKKLTQEIKEKLHIPATVGIGTNMYLAKIALDITAKKNEDRIGWLNEEKFKETLWQHTPITDFWGISTGISTRLFKYGITNMEGITKINPDTLYKEFGINAELIIDHAFGREPCLMSDIKSYKSKAKSISGSQILPCDYSFDEAKLILKEMIQSGCYDLYKKQYVTSSVGIYVGYKDMYERGGSHGSIRLPVTTNLYSVMIEYIENLFDKIVDRNIPIRRLGYGFGDVQSAERERYDLLTDESKIDKEKKLTESVLKIQDKHGKNAVLKARDYCEKATAIERNGMIGGHNAGKK